MNTRLDSAVTMGWEILTELQVTPLSDTAGTDPRYRSRFWLGKLEGMLVEILDALEEERKSDGIR